MLSGGDEKGIVEQDTGGEESSSGPVVSSPGRHASAADENGPPISSPASPTPSGDDTGDTATDDNKGLSLSLLYITHAACHICHVIEIAEEGKLLAQLYKG